MQPIAGYLYKQNITVIKNADFSPYRENQLVYAKPLHLYKGIENRFQLIIRNNDQKPVNLRDHTVVFNLTDSATRELLFSRQLNIVWESTGTMTTILEDSILSDIKAGMYTYSVIVVNPEGKQQVVYADDNYQAQGKARVHDSIYGEFQPSVKPAILNYVNNVAHTSVIQNLDRSKSRAVLQTAQYNCTDFTGTIQVQATQNADIMDITPDIWFTVATATLVNFYGSDYMTFQGKFNAVRFVITRISGDVNYILYRS